MPRSRVSDPRRKELSYPHLKCFPYTMTELSVGHEYSYLSVRNIFRSLKPSTRFCCLPRLFRRLPPPAATTRSTLATSTVHTTMTKDLTNATDNNETASTNGDMTIPVEPKPQQQQKRFNFYNAQEILSETSKDAGDDTDKEPKKETRRFNFYDAAEVQKQVASWNNAREEEAVAPAHKRTCSQPTALIVSAAASSAVVTPATTRSPSAHGKIPTQHATTPSTTAQVVDSNEILRNLQETERQHPPPPPRRLKRPQGMPTAAPTPRQDNTNSRRQTKNPYEQAIQEALAILHQRKEQQQSTTAVQQQTHQDMVMQLRNEEPEFRMQERQSRQERIAKYASKLVEMNTEKMSPSTYQDTDWTLPVTADNNTAERMIRLRSESDDYYENAQDAPSVDTNTTSEEVQKGVEQVLLAILERANASSNNSSSSQQPQTTPRVNHTTELDALTKAMENLLQPSMSFETVSTTSRTRRPNRREIEQHALDGMPPNQSLVNEFLAVMDDNSASSSSSSSSSVKKSSSVVEEVLQGQFKMSIQDKTKSTDSVEKKVSSEYVTSASSSTELRMDESAESIEVVDSTDSVHDKRDDVAESQSGSTSYEESTETDEYEDDEFDPRETSVDASALTRLLGKLSKGEDEDGDDEESDDYKEDDEYDEKNTSVDESTLTNVLGPLSRQAGGTTGVVLEATSADTEEVPPPPTKDDSSGPLSPASIYETLSSAVRDAESFMSYISGGYPSASKDKYSTGEDDEIAVAGRSPGSGDFDADAHELMRSLCAHLLPYGVDKSVDSPKLERIPIWDESNPDEAGYRIIRLSKRQLRAVEREFDKMVKSVKHISERDLNCSLSKADTKDDWNGVTDDDFARDLEEAEELLDQEEKRLEEADRRAKVRTEREESDEESEILSSETESDSSSVSDTMEGTSSPVFSETDDDTMLTSHPDFPGVKTPGKGEIGDLEFFHLPIIYKSNVTGFEPTKDLYLEPGNVVAGQYLVENELGSAAFSTAYRCVDLSSETRTEEGKVSGCRNAGRVRQCSAPAHKHISSALSLQRVQEEVCLKVIKNTKDFFDQSLDEIKILELLRQTGKCHEKHILEMRTFFYHREHLIIVTELLRQNLFEFGKFITDSDEEPYFTRPRLCYITRQVLTALDFVHKMGLVHSDVKPENILLSSYSRAQVKLIDFGSSCYLTDRQSSYIQSRSYRAPEVVLGLPYDGKIDMWSLGCVVAEMYTGEVTFQNDSIVSMLSRIEAICGPFPRHMIAQGRQSNRFFTKSGLLFEYVDTENGDGSPMKGPADKSLLDVFQPKRTTLAARLGIPDIETEEEAHFVDFCSKLLAVDPDSRPTAEQALKHPWIVGAESLTEQDIKYPSK